MWYIILITLLYCNTLTGQTSAPVLAFEERAYEFGEIAEENGKVSHTFIFKNQSNKPIVITNVRSGCGCIASEYTSEPIASGQKGKVEVTFDPKYRPGFFSKEIVVLTNQNNQYTRIWIKGTVIPLKHPVEEDYPYNFGNGLHLNRKVLSLGKVKKGTTKEIELGYANDNDQPMNLIFVVEENSINLTFTNPEEIAPNGQGKITFTYHAPKYLNGEISLRISPYINDQKAAEPVFVRCTLVD